MKVFLTGANGFVGTNLARFLCEDGHEVSALVRNGSKAGALPKQVSIVVGDPTGPGQWQENLGKYDLFINLAGANIFRRWDEGYKKLLRESRIETTRHLVDALPSSGVLLSTSAVGYYGFTGDEELNEASPPGKDFLAQLAVDWENEAFRAESKGIRVIATRFGVVLGKGGGALEQMVRPFKFFVGGPIGDGKQWMSWIHIQDLCRAMVFAAGNQNIKGSVNFCSPEPVTNKKLSAEIGNVLHRPHFLPAPGFAVRLALGEFGSVILKGQRVYPKKLLDHGFVFSYGGIRAALTDLLD